ncbi:hypothetical protein R6Q59_033300 [Mikania micrantha]
MSSSSSSSSIRKKHIRIFKVGFNGNVYCNHDMVAITRIAESRSTRQGHKFYGCILWPSWIASSLYRKKKWMLCFQMDAIISCLNKKGIRSEDCKPGKSESVAGRDYDNGVLSSTKHGVQTDRFEQRGKSWFVATDIPSDFLVQIGDVSFHLHKVVANVS